MNDFHMPHNGLPCNGDCDGLRLRAAAVSDAEAAWLVWDDSSAEPFLDAARYGFITGYLSARGFEA